MFSAAKFLFYFFRKVGSSWVIFMIFTLVETRDLINKRSDLLMIPHRPNDSKGANSRNRVGRVNCLNYYTIFN